MTQAGTFRDNARNCADLAASTKDEPSRNRYKRMEDAWLALAEEQDWLDGNVSPVEKIANPSNNAPTREAPNEII
jgi:hypothetical protein